jgi:inosine triphosphate pyrophosphatase
MSRRLGEQTPNPLSIRCSCHGSEVFVTGNAHKLKEVTEIIAPYNIEIEARSLDVPEIQGTTQEVAIAKCRAAAELVNGPCITEDTALCFKALNGLPGPYIKHFMASVGHEGLNAMLTGFDTKEATAICTFAYSSGPGVEPYLFEGHTEGIIVPARGPKVFGWDAAFQPFGGQQTYAEMPPEQKNILSHRSKALDKLREHLSK